VIDPNIGVPNSTVNVTITGQFTHFAGSTQANFGAGISVNGAAQGAFGTIAVSSATTAVALLTIDPSATAGPRNITVVTGGEVLNVNSGFTVQTVSPTAPTVTFYSPAYGATGVPINTEVAMLFSAPIDRNTVSAANIRVMDTVTQGYCWYDYGRTIPGTVNVDASGRIVTFLPSAVLAVGRQYYVCVNYGQQGTANGIQDPSGNQVSATTSVFTTGFANDSGASLHLPRASRRRHDRADKRADRWLHQAVDPITVPDGLTVMNGRSLVRNVHADYKQITFVLAAGSCRRHLRRRLQQRSSRIRSGTHWRTQERSRSRPLRDRTGGPRAVLPLRMAVIDHADDCGPVQQKALNPLSIGNRISTYVNGRSGPCHGRRRTRPSIASGDARAVETAQSWRSVLVAGDGLRSGRELRVGQRELRDRHERRCHRPHGAVGLATGRQRLDRGQCAD
jgi:hypothetical protein